MAIKSKKPKAGVSKTIHIEKAYVDKRRCWLVITLYYVFFSFSVVFLLSPGPLNAHVTG